LVISPGLYDTDSGDIRLIPTFEEGDINNLALAHSPLSTTDAADLLAAEIPKNISVGQNFFYLVEKYNSETGALFDIEFSELGIGELQIRDNQHYLRRETAFEQKTLEDGVHFPLPNHFLPFDPADYVSVSTYMPTDFIQLCAQEHSALCTTDTYVATPVELDTNTVLGRSDGNIEALGSTEIHNILGYSDPSDAVKNYTGSLILATSLLELIGDNSKVVSHQLHLRSRVDHPSTRTKGYLIFNDNKRAFEGYDGTKWRPLAWADEVAQFSAEGLRWIIDGDTVVLYDANNNVLKTGAAVYGPRL
jgi:hypothetical protein